MGHKYASERKLPRLDEQRHAAPETPPHRSRKDTKRWCRGKPGVDHVTAMRLSKHGIYYLTQRWGTDSEHGSCGWRQRRKWQWIGGVREWEPTGDWGYACWHERFCTGCGKILDHGPSGRECPDWKPR